MMKFRLHLGHVGLLDAAPLLIAQEQGYFVEESLDVTLSCELGLATVCGKLADQRMDGACLPAPLPVLLSLGAGVPRVAMRAVTLCAWQGMGVVLARSRDSARPRDTSPARIGVVAPGAPTRLLLHKLAQSTGAPVAADVLQVPMAASQLIEFLREGMLDGFCGLDPLPALARLHCGAESVADSASLFPGHPGSVVALRAERSEHLPPPVLAALERGLTRAREFCANPANRASVWRLVLGQPPYAEIEPGLREALVAHVVAGEAGWSSLRFDAPASERAGLSQAAEVFLENACRGAAGSSARAFDFKAEIARVYPRRDVAVLSRQKVNT